jgi:hypothetical protein
MIVGGLGPVISDTERERVGIRTRWAKQCFPESGALLTQPCQDDLAMMTPERYCDD